MPESQDYEELCARLRIVAEREDLSSDQKVESFRKLLFGAPAQPLTGQHQWRETGSVPLPPAGEDETAQGQSIQYACSKCGASGYQIVFPTSVTMYPIVTDDPKCRE